MVVFYSYSFLLFLLELPIELDNPIVMESLRDFAENESEDTLNAFTSPTGYEPKFLTFGELYNPSAPLSLRIPLSDQGMDDVTLGKMPTEAHRGQADYCVPEGVSVSQSSSSVRFERSGQPDGRERSGQPDGESSSNAQIRTLLEKQRQTIIAQYREQVSHHELQAAQAEEDRRCLQEQLWRQKLEFREAQQQSLTELEELRKFQNPTFDAVEKRKFVEAQNTILELSSRIQELQNEVNCTNDSRDFQDAESVRSGNSHVTSQPVLFPLHPKSEGMLSFGTPRLKERPPSIWDTQGISGNVFAHPRASSSAPYPQELNQWKSSVEAPLNLTTVEKDERPGRNQDLRCQSGPSAKDSVLFGGGDSSNNFLGRPTTTADFGS